jgi:hypothetical protein
MWIQLLLLCASREYADFRVSSDGEVQGVGLLIAADPNSGRLVVLAPIQGGPADRAGIQPGDEVGQHLDHHAACRSLCIEGASCMRRVSHPSRSI